MGERKVGAKRVQREGKEGASAPLGGAPRSFGEAQDRPSSGRTEGGEKEPSGEAEAPAHEVSAQMVIKGGRNREVQLVAAGRRKRFQGKLRDEFLEWLAATANVVWSARKVGICHQTVWKHRMNDPVFAEGFDRALEQATARVRAKLVESKEKAEPIEINGDYEAPELDEVDPQVALNLLREHERSAGGPAAGFGRKQGRRPRVATNAEVRAALVKRLKVFGIRVARKAGGEEEGSAELRKSGR